MPVHIPGKHAPSQRPANPPASSVPIPAARVAPNLWEFEPLLCVDEVAANLGFLAPRSTVGAFGEIGYLPAPSGKTVARVRRTSHFLPRTAIPWRSHRLHF